MQAWTPPDHWQRITTVDAHTAGEPLRIITGGLPDLPGETILEKRRYAQTHLEGLRRTLMWEPRGHADMYGCILTPPATPDGDLGVLFMHNEGFSTMCGHGIIGLVKVGVETGALPAAGPQATFNVDTPAGRVVATAHLAGGRVERVSFVNVPSFLLARDLVVTPPGLGQVCVDIAFGGAFYAYVDAAALGLSLDLAHARELIDAGMRIKRAVMDGYQIEHPAGDPALNFLYGTIFVQLTPQGDAHSRNVCIFAEGEVDRCPTGTGVSGRLAIHHARGELGVGEPIVVESILDTRFSGCILGTTQVGELPAVSPEITGTAHITGRHEFLVDPDDPLARGFLIR
jgi:trans-L-3-hydroxyproline dehydratase